MPPCDVPGCPVLAPDGSTTCALHQTARLATAVGCVDRTCVRCRRKIGKDDYVLTEPQAKTGRHKPGEPYGWQHASCDPKVSRVHKRDEPKALLEVCDDAS